MKIIGVAACTVGIAHTYIAQEKLENAIPTVHAATPTIFIFYLSLFSLMFA